MPTKCGTTTGYRYGCRCDECRAAQAAYLAGKKPVGRPPNERLRYYMETYSATRRNVYTLGIAQLDRMTDDARRVMFNSLDWYPSKGKFNSMDVRRCVPLDRTPRRFRRKLPTDARIRRMLYLAGRLRAA